MPIETVWRWLGTVSVFDLVIRHHQTDDPVYQATGRIIVAVHGGMIVWREDGDWVIGELSGIHFTNTTRWERVGPVEIGVSHQRRGPSPLFLSTLRPTEGGAWSGEPHLCGADRYWPILVPAPDHLVLTWDVMSPTDPYRREMRVR